MPVRHPCSFVLRDFAYHQRHDCPHPSCEVIICVEPRTKECSFSIRISELTHSVTGVVMVGQNLLCSSSLTQRVVALSSGEAEHLASASCLCDALFARQLVAFLENDTLPQVHHHLDAVAAKGMMERAGVGRVRHLGVRVLWIQGLVDDETILLHKIPTATNPSDLRTKSLSRARVRLLLYLLGAYDAILDNPVGEPEYAELQHRQAMKDAVRAVLFPKHVSGKTIAQQ